jgi:translation initiation factor 5B
LLEFLKSSKIPVAGVNIGPVHRKDVLKATKALNQDKPKKEFAAILAFDVKVVKDAQDFADENNIKIFTAQIIYHLFDSFKEYVE